MLIYLRWEGCSILYIELEWIHEVGFGRSITIGMGFLSVEVCGKVWFSQWKKVEVDGLGRLNGERWMVKIGSLR